MVEINNPCALPGPKTKYCSAAGKTATISIAIVSRVLSPSHCENVAPLWTHEAVQHNKHKPFSATRRRVVA